MRKNWSCGKGNNVLMINKVKQNIFPRQVQGKQFTKNETKVERKEIGMNNFRVCFTKHMTDRTICYYIYKCLKRVCKTLKQISSG